MLGAVAGNDEVRWTFEVVDVGCLAGAVDENARDLLGNLKAAVMSVDRSKRMSGSFGSCMLV